MNRDADAAALHTAAPPASPGSHGNAMRHRTALASHDSTDACKPAADRARDAYADGTTTWRSKSACLFVTRRFVDEFPRHFFQSESNKFDA